MGDCKVYVGRLDLRATEDDVFDLFEKFGRVTSGMYYNLCLVLIRIKLMLLFMTTDQKNRLDVPKGNMQLM